MAKMDIIQELLGLGKAQMPPIGDAVRMQNTAPGPTNTVPDINFLDEIGLGQYNDPMAVDGQANPDHILAMLQQGNYPDQTEAMRKAVLQAALGRLGKIGMEDNNAGMYFDALESGGDPSMLTPDNLLSSFQSGDSDGLRQMLLELSNRLAPKDMNFEDRVLHAKALPEGANLNKQKYLDASIAAMGASSPEPGMGSEGLEGLLTNLLNSGMSEDEIVRLMMEALNSPVESVSKRGLENDYNWQENPGDVDFIAQMMGAR